MKGLFKKIMYYGSCSFVHQCESAGVNGETPGKSINGEFGIHF